MEVHSVVGPGDSSLDEFLLGDVDASVYLPTSWIDDLHALALSSAVRRTLRPTSVTSREADADLLIPVETVSGRAIRDRAAWLYGLYHTAFRDLAQEVSSEPVSTAVDDRYGVNINVQRGSTARYECHVDSNPIEGLLFVTEHPGGDLIVSRDSAARGPVAIGKDAIRVRPRRGRFVLFDARELPHYVAPLHNDTDTRLVVAMNFYVTSCSEADRPPDLNRHLFGED